MEDILLSIINGQRVQAWEYIKESNLSFSDVINELIISGYYEEIPRMYNIGVNREFITEE